VVEHEAIRSYQALSEEYLAAAETVAAAGHLAPLGADVCARVNRLVHAYDAPRYPDWEAPPDARDDLAFIATFVRGRLPRLLAEGRA